MTTFLSTCLYAFAGCAVLGLIPAALLAARARQPVMAVAVILAVAFAVSVLVTAAGDLR